MYKIGIDVGGTNTDAVLIDQNLNIVESIKVSTTDDIYGGILSALQYILKTSKVDPKKITQAMLGTTQCTNAIVERKKLSDIALIRIGAPAMQGVLPMIDWPEDLKFFVKEYISVAGGYEYDGKELAPFDKQATADFLQKIKGKVSAIAITCVFSPVRNEHEDECEALVKEILGDVHVSKSSQIGSLSFIERENATIINAGLHKVADSFTVGFAKSLSENGITNADVYLSQNDGTLMTMDLAQKYPILTIACGPTNSIRGASYLSQLADAIVIDVGGTTTDFGVIQNGFPRESSVAVTIGGVRTNFRMPDVASIGLGGGSIVREQNGVITIGPDSVGHRIQEDALVFGGAIMTTTDIAVRLGLADLGDKNLVSHIDLEFAEKVQVKIKEIVEDNIDKMKTSSQDCEVILVGGGSIIFPENFAGASKVLKPNHFTVANAIGSAISKVSGNFEQLISYDQTPREQVLEQAKAEARDLAAKAGAIPETITIVEIEEIPLAYYPGNTNKVRIKAAGDIRS